MSVRNKKLRILLFLTLSLPCTAFFSEKPVISDKEYDKIMNDIDFDNILDNANMPSDEEIKNN